MSEQQGAGLSDSWLPPGLSVSRLTLGPTDQCYSSVPSLLAVDFFLSFHSGEWARALMCFCFPGGSSPVP